MSWLSSQSRLSSLQSSSSLCRRLSHLNKPRVFYHPHEPEYAPKGFRHCADSDYFSKEIVRPHCQQMNRLQCTEMDDDNAMVLSHQFYASSAVNSHKDSYWLCWVQNRGPSVGLGRSKKQLFTECDEYSSVIKLLIHIIIIIIPLFSPPPLPPRFLLLLESQYSMSVIYRKWHNSVIAARNHLPLLNFLPSHLFKELRWWLENNPTKL